MKDIYEIILKGIQNQENLNDIQLVERLKNLQLTVKRLRRLYYNCPVYVPYEEIDIQAAYLLVYFPHYYQLIYKTLLEEYPTIFNDREDLKLLYFGGGPGPEVYGTLKYIANNASHVNSVEIIIFDINAAQWEYSHKILNGYILPSLGLNHISLTFRAESFDLTAPFEKEIYKKYFIDCDLSVFQNCLNEIPIDDKNKLLSNVDSIIDLVPPQGSVIVNDLAGGYQAVKSLLQEIELQAIDKKDVSVVHTSCSMKQFYTLISIHSNPPPIIRDNLLISTDGLVPRKYIKYNYCFLSKTKFKKEKIDSLGLRALYSPLDFKYLDTNNALHSKSFVGIDFGTSTTIINLARVIDGKIITESINIEQKDIHGDKDYPIRFDSAIALTSDFLLFGKHAYSLKNELTLHKNIWHSFKNELGKNSVYSESVLKNDPDYKIADTNDAISLYFWYLKMNIEKYLAQKKYPDNIKYAVSIPASFKEQQRTQFLKCLKNVGIVMNNHPFIDEPIAAFISCVYENHEKGLSLDAPKNVLVLDLGAGTCDISVLNVGKDENGIYARNLSIARYGNIGGEKLDAMIAEKVLKKQFFNSIGNESEAAYKNAFNQICSIAEKIKIKLCKSIDVFPEKGFSLPDKALSEEMVWLPNQKNN